MPCGLRRLLSQVTDTLDAGHGKRGGTRAISFRSFWSMQEFGLDPSGNERREGHRVKLLYTKTSRRGILGTITKEEMDRMEART